MWLVGVGGIYGCGFKEIYRFPHTTYPYYSCICTFLQQHPYFFVHFYKCFSFFLLEDRAKCKVEDRIRTHQMSHICPFNGNMACLNWEILNIYGMSY